MVSVKNKILEQLEDKRCKDISEIIGNLNGDEKVLAESIIADFVDEGIVKSSSNKGRTMIQLSKNVKLNNPQQEKKPDYEIVATLPESIRNVKEKGLLTTRKVFQEIIEHSEGKLLVSEPFIDNAFVEICLDQLRDASKRGVKLVLLTRKIDSDSSSLKALLRVYEIFSMNSPNKSALEVYEHWTPLKTQWDYSRQFVGLHAKLMINQVEAYIGSANWTEFSLGNNVEFGFLVRDVTMLRRLKDLFELTMSQAQRIDIEKTHAKATSRGWK